MHARSSLVILVFVIACAACSSDKPPSPAVASTTVKAVVVDTAGMDERALRAAISAAIRDQRLYAPAGNNAIELQMALRERRPDDSSVITTLMELEPYAVIAAEQSVARNQFDEANRLIGMIERANPEASALPRLRELLAAQTERHDADTAAAALAQAAAISEEARVPAPVVATEKQTAVVVAAPPASPASLKPAPAPAPVPEKAPSVTAPVAITSAASAPASSNDATPMRMPNLLRDRTPRYPGMALRRKIEGSVDLAFTIRGDGSVSDVRVVNATPPGFFEEAAIASSQYWQFEALGRDVSTRRNVKFSLPKPAP